jgi:hypothetical protein
MLAKNAINMQARNASASCSVTDNPALVEAPAWAAKAKSSFESAINTPSAKSD